MKWKSAQNSVSSSPTAIFQPIDYIKLTIFGFALSALWSSLHSVIMPLRLLDFVPEAQKNTYLDLLILAGLILAMVVQLIAGAISDRSGFRWGRRRPYILLGSLLVMLFLPGIGFYGTYSAIFITYCLLQVGSNIADGPYRAFFPDLVPERKRGLASGVRNVLNILGGIAVVRLAALFMDRYFAGEGTSWLWLALMTIVAILMVAMLITIVTVKEKRKAASLQLPSLTTLYKSFKTGVRRRTGFILFVAGCFFVFSSWHTLIGHAMYYFMDVVGMTRPAEITSNFLVVVGICLLLTVYPAGYLSDRIGRKPIAVTSALLSALGVITLFFFRSHTLIMLSGGILGICGGAWMSSQWTMAIDLVGEGNEARDLGLVNISSAGAGILSRSIGPAIDYFNAHSANLGYHFMLFFCVFCLIAGSIFLAIIKTAAPPEESRVS